MPEILFDEWPERYEQWFTTPIGKLVKQCETELVGKLLDVHPGERVLDAGCGTAIFTMDFLAAGAEVVGLDISAPMLRLAVKKTAGYPFVAVRGDMRCLPFRDNSFDKTVSVTALEFIQDAKSAVSELFRVTRPGGYVVVATLNSLSPWTTRRRAKTLRGQRHVLENAFFRSPDELLACANCEGTTGTAVHFEKDENPERAVEIEQSCRLRGLDSGAFVVARWQKPI